jgi:hypothetical protein
MNHDGVHTSQVLVHRKMLHLKGFHRRHRGDISPMVKGWTVE